MTEAEKERAAVVRKKGFFAQLERILFHDLTALICFVLLLRALDFTTWQFVLALILYVKFTTSPAAWLLAERTASAEHLKEGR